MNNEEKTEETVKKKGKSKIILVLLLTLVLAAGAGVGFYFVWQSTNYLVTDNARVTTTLVAITPSIPGPLERFTVYEGRYVTENEILGWVENSEAMRSPVDGLVIHSSVVQGQMVSPAEPVAVIASANNLHIQANIEETDVLRIQKGQYVSVTIDPFGSRQFSGYVSEIGSITAAELTGNAMFFNTGGTFTRVTHLIPVKINLLDDINLSHLIGVNARVRIPLRQPVINNTAIRPAALANSITVRGTVESVQRRSVYTTLGYMVERVYVEAGDIVSEGQVLGVLDTRDLVNAANIQILNAEASLRIAEINLATAVHNHETIRILHDARAIPRNDMQQSEFSLQSATASRQAAMALLGATRLALGRQMENAVIRSPANGVVTAVYAREGAVGMGLLFVIDDTDNLKITTSFREQDLGRVRTGMGVIITSDATGNAEYAGTISRINPAASAFAPVAEFEAEVLVTSPNTGLRIGMNTRLNIILER